MDKITIETEDGETIVYRGVITKLAESASAAKNPNLDGSMSVIKSSEAELLLEIMYVDKERL